MGHLFKSIEIIIFFRIEPTSEGPNKQTNKDGIEQEKMREANNEVNIIAHP